MSIPSSLVTLVGAVLLHFVWQGTAIALALGFAMLLTPRRWARPRYLVACLALGAMAVAPLATIARLSSTAPGGSVVSGVFESPGTTPLLAAVTSAAATPVPASRLAEQLPTGIDWLPWFVAAWAAGVLVSSARLAGGWAQARRLLHHDATAADAAWAEAVSRLSARLGLRRPVRLLESARVQVPVVIGALRPVLLLPASAISGLAPAQVEAVLAHELAHIRRHDYLVNLLQSVVETLLFYHPGVWWVSHTIRVEREHCCDDLAVSACGDPVLYARALTAIETMRQGSTGMALAVSDGSLLSRVRRLLGVSQPPRLASSGWVVATATALLVAGAGLASYARDLTHLLPSLHFTEAVEAQATPPRGSRRAIDTRRRTLSRRSRSCHRGTTGPTVPAPPAGVWPGEPDDPEFDARLERRLNEAVSRSIAQMEREFARRPVVDAAAIDALVQAAVRTATDVMRDPQLRESRARALANAERAVAAHRAEIDRAVAEASRQATEQVESHRADIDRALAEAMRSIDLGRESAKIIDAHRPEIEKAVAEASRAVAAALDEHRDEIGRAIDEATRSLVIASERLERHRQAPPAPPVPGRSAGASRSAAARPGAGAGRTARSSGSTGGGGS